MAFRNRVAEHCTVEVTLLDAVKGDKTFKRIGRERSGLVARCHQKHQVPCGGLHARRTPRRLSNLTVVSGTFGKHLSSPIQVRSVAGSEKQRCRVPRGDGRRCIQSARGQEERTARQVEQGCSQPCDRRLVENRWR